MIDGILSEISRTSAGQGAEILHHAGTLRDSIELAAFGYARHQVIFDDAGKPVDYVYLDANAAFTEMTGLEKRDVIGRRVTEVIPGIRADDFDWIGFYGGLSLRGGRESFERGSEAMGRWYRVEAVSAQRGSFETFFHDISPQRRAQAEGELFRNAVLALKQPALITADDGTILEVNGAFCAMYGYARAEIVGANPRVLNPGPGVYENLGYDAGEYKRVFRDMWEAIGDPARGTWEGELVNRKRDGSLVWVKLIINAFGAGEGRRFIGLPVDISANMRRERESRVRLNKAIADLAALRDDETGNHMRRVGILAKLVAKALGMPERYCADLEDFAPMHDIGKVGILDSILLARRKLTPDEAAAMRMHTVLGHNIVKGAPELEMAAAITLNHHERHDGTGYPAGKRGGEIPLSARITAVVDVYDALRSERPYKRAWSHAEAREEILRGAGSQFDPALVAVFAGLAPAFERVFAEIGD